MTRRRRRRRRAAFRCGWQLDIVSAGKNYNKIRKALCSGFFHHAAKKDPQALLTYIEGIYIYI